MDVAARRMLPEELKWVKNSWLAWQGAGFYYSRYDAPQDSSATNAASEGHKVYFHKAGTPQSEDVLVYEDKANPQRWHFVQTSADERFALLNIFDRAKGKRGTALFFRDRLKKDQGWMPIVSEVGNDLYGFIDETDGKFLLLTDRNAPNRRLVRVDPANPSEANWTEILPEEAELLSSVGTGSGKLFASYQKDVITRVYVHALDGKRENEVEMPGPGAAYGFGGNLADPAVFYTFSSFNFPPAIYRYDVASKKTTRFRAPEIPSFNADDFETKQVFYTSRDGTRVPMFITHKKGLKLDGTNPTLLYGYGGFNAITAPAFDALRIALLEQGVVYASANIRGGGEYGKAWHEAGMKLKKQNTFDDFIAAAEWLITNRYTSPQKLAIQGVSNGGLLVAAVANQRPDLFRAVIAQAGVMDMLRSRTGAGDEGEYGSLEKPDEFKAIYAYSPIHNVRGGVKYPAVLITTADQDDRVLPAHAFKYAAVLQEKQSGDSPILLRVDTNSGHWASSTAKAVEQTTDIYSFLLYTLGVKPTD